jgi:hypothetical protein
MSVADAADECCRVCRFWQCAEVIPIKPSSRLRSQIKAGDLGFCRRHPTSHLKSHNSWCREFQHKT